MNVIRGCRWVLSVGALALVGCVPGYNSMIFATKTNAGLVVDTKPPEVNVDIGRFEGLLAPTYEAGKTPPVMASFRFDSNKGFLSNYIGSAFTTGDAAVAMSRLYNEDDPKNLADANKVDLADEPAKRPGEDWRKFEKNYDSAVDLALEPKMPWFVPKEKPGAVRPVLFATDTSFGFKVSWQDPESPVPDYLRLAYQRRELAFAAVTIGPKLHDHDQDDTTPPQVKPGLEARVPSLLATVDAQVRANEFINSDFNYLQYFASGSAATALAMRKGVRKAMLHRLDPKQEQSSSSNMVKPVDGEWGPCRKAVAYYLAKRPDINDESRNKAVKQKIKELFGISPSVTPWVNDGGTSEDQICQLQKAMAIPDAPSASTGSTSGPNSGATNAPSTSPGNTGIGSPASSGTTPPTAATGSGAANIAPASTGGTVPAPATGATGSTSGGNNSPPSNSGGNGAGASDRNP